MTEFRGARGSNTGDDFHELWATRQSIRLLSNEDGLEALTVEGLAARDEAGSSEDTWDGVDCSLYFGGSNATDAKHIILEQLKYSAATPETPWTVARIVGGKRRDRSVIARLAKAWKSLQQSRPRDSAPGVVLISNQPIDSAVISAFSRAAATPMIIPRAKPKNTATVEARLAYATGLNADEFQAFSAAIRFKCGAGSRFALEEQVLRAIADWTDQDVQRVVTGLRQFIRHRMRPEFAGELITRESVMLHLGASEGSALFPCPSEITWADAPVSRAPVREATKRLLFETQYLCLHGGAGVGKTTALQEIEDCLPSGSIMIVYDCYGGGRYLDPSALRHRPADAFLQLTNELACRLKLPMLLSRHQGSDYPRMFANRLKHAANAVAMQHSAALIVVAIDAADNAVTAAQNRAPAEASFIHDFVFFTGQPENVRFIVTTRTGRLEQLRLPSSFQTIEIEPFSRPETGENVCRLWSASEPWIDDFHHLSSGVPRVQTYAFKVDGAHPSAALDRLRPAGKSLNDVFEQQFNEALSKGGNPMEVAQFCAGLIALPRPVPLADLAAVLDSTETHLADICADLAPGIRVHGCAVSFADEDFEQFIRKEGLAQLGEVQKAVAAWLLSRATEDRYAALNVAAALVSANRGAELLDLVEREPAPIAVADPVLRREAELQRLRLAIKVCREAGDAPRALRFVLIGAEGIKTEAALRELLVSNPDMAANFAQETAGRLILSDPDYIHNHGPLLFQKLSVDADLGDAISVREGRRLLNAWMQVRRDHLLTAEKEQHRRVWKISTSDVCSNIEAAFKLDGPAAALNALESWTPRRIALDVALSLPPRLIAEGCIDDIESLTAGDQLGPVGKLFLLIPLSFAGRAVDLDLLAYGLAELSRRKLKLEHFFNSGHEGSSTHWFVLDTTLTACEILTSKSAALELVDEFLESFLAPKLRQIEQRRPSEATKLDFLFRAHALKAARAGRATATKDIFQPRPNSNDKSKRQYTSTREEEHDQALMDLTGAVFSIYAAVADALVNHKTNAELNDSLRRAVDVLKRDTWRISRHHGSTAVRWQAAKSLLVLLSAGYDPLALKRFATEVHGRWCLGYEVPNVHVVARLSLRQELHTSLLEDLASAATESRKMRIGANEKSKMLINLARLIKPISAPDANALFNDAVDAASELDQEVMAQIRLMDRLICCGAGTFSNHQWTARRVSDVVADAAIRLDGYDYFPWDESMSSLTRLDAPLALANTARWDYETIASLNKTLPPLLKTALKNGSLRPAQASALTLFLDSESEVLIEAMEQADANELPCLHMLTEEIAHDLVVKHVSPPDDAAIHYIERQGIDGPWVNALRSRKDFLSLLPPFPPQPDHNKIKLLEKNINVLGEHVWDRDTLQNSAKLRSAIKALQDQGRAARNHLPISVILSSARSAVSLRDRVKHLSALSELDDLTITDEAAKALLNAIDAWRDSPAVKSWCRTNLPEVIIARLPELSSYLQYGTDDLTPALKITGMNDAELQELVLRGIERHVDGFGSDRIFALAGIVGDKLTPHDAAGLVDWYAQRLAERIPPKERDQAAPTSSLPQDIDEAVARFIFAYMGDYDLRMRWRAAHAVRRLARLSDNGTLIALIAQYGRREEIVFCGRNHAFYWLAARLWFVVAWDHVAGERPDIGGHAGLALLQIALDDTFPHLLVRSFARDACEKLVAAGCLTLSTQKEFLLRCVNETPLPRSPAVESTRRYFGNRDDAWRFPFDSMDTLPYWYEPLLRAFANLDGARFLQTVEHWIIDVWGYSGDIHSYDKERRRRRFEDRDWALSSNRHGSTPTLEYLNNHLEWHAMWCAAGELLKTEPLVPLDDDGLDVWDDLGSRIKRQKLSEPPLWSADLLTPIPLIMCNWRVDSRLLDEWVLAVVETDHRAEILPGDQPDHVVVDSYIERRTGDRIETISVSSALSSPITSSALLRALQTMDDAWDYKLPSEGEHFEIDQEPYRLLGWLRESSRDTGIDDKDPLRGYASIIKVIPGHLVTESCSLTRDKAYRARWSKDSAQTPMFIFETWGEQSKDNERYTSYTCSGHRLLVHKEQLQDFLNSQTLDLIIEAEVTRRGRDTHQYAREEENKKTEGRFDRLYRLHGRGFLEVAEGCLGSWTDDRARA